MTAWPTPTRVRTRHLVWLADRLSPRDWSILVTVNRLHLVTGPQLQRLHFATATNLTTQAIHRSQALTRLVAWRVLMPLPRRIGGIQRGSTVAVYALDTAGQQLLRRAAPTHAAPKRIRRPGPPGDRWTRHILAVAELYVRLVEADRAGVLQLRDFRAEPAAWWPDDLGGWLKPDAYAVVSNGSVDHLWWLEVDLGTEHLPTVKRKLHTYLDFDRRGGLGPRRTMPRVMMTVTNGPRRRALADWITGQPAPAADLLRVELHDDAVPVMARLLPPRASGAS
jgi:hypothetical protein